MNRFLILVFPQIILLHSGITIAQNLVPNPDFESTVSCPTDHGQVSHAVSWKSATAGTSDYFNSCAGTACATAMPWVCVPDNWTGTETPRSGNAYMGFFAHWNPVGLDYREYIQCPLTEPLEAGVTYEVSCYVSLGDDSQFACNGVGLVFTNDSIYSAGTNNLGQYTPQVGLEEPMTEKDGWTRVSGCFTAVGGERYCTIGNFYSDAATTFEQVPGGATLHSYYYVDDVSVTRSEEFNPIDLGPDVTTGCEGDSLTVNVIGNIVWQDGSTDHSYTITESGTYWITITTGECRWTDTLIVDYADCENPEEEHPEEPLLEMPNVFSPDGDGINEGFVPLPYTNLSGASMEICNRWGQTVFRTNDLHTGWDGRSEGEPCSEGVYFWTLRGTDPTNPGKTLHGFLTLVRD